MKVIYLKIRFVLPFVILPFVITAQMESNLIWVDSFSSNEKSKVAQWLEAVEVTVFENLGKYPFTMNLYIHRRDHAKEPVPWAHTVRFEEQGVHFHIDPDFSLEEFEKDWTAPHEIAHLSIPFIGKRNMWFSEGYASYLQWILLEKQGVYSTEEIKVKLESKLKLVKRYYNTEDSFVSTSNRLKEQHNYPALYWGGACYFFQIDKELRSDHDISLLEVIKQYQTNGRLEDQNIGQVLNSLDRTSSSTVFSDLFEKFQTRSAREVIMNTVYE